MNKPKPGLHPQNIHRFGYDFDRLAKAYPGLLAFLRPNPYGSISIDFSNPEAVIALNKALLITHYGIQGWHLPKGNLCPPIPGRTDYLYYLRDLFGQPDAPLRGMDIGTGASGIYSLIGASAFGWKFIATDIDKKSIANLKSILSKNPQLQHKVDCRVQQDASRIFHGVWHAGERVDFTMCNPPFHASAKEATAAAARKNRNLNLGSKNLNFGGASNELWCPGGEKRFVSHMVTESVEFRKNCKWFTTLISKKENLQPLIGLLEKVGAKHQTIHMAQGQKTSRFLAWTFED